MAAEQKHTTQKTPTTAGACPGTFENPTGGKPDTGPASPGLPRPLRLLCASDRRCMTDESGYFHKDDGLTAGAGS